MDSAIALSSDPEGRAEWIEKWADAARSGSAGSLAEMDEEIDRLERLWEKSASSEDIGARDEAGKLSAMSSKLLYGLVDAGEGGQIAAARMVERCGSSFMEALRCGSSIPGEGDLLLRAMLALDAKLAKALCSKGWSPDSFAGSTTMPLVDKRRPVSFAGPWSVLFWKHPDKAAAFQDAWKAEVGENEAMLPSPAMNGLYTEGGADGAQKVWRPLSTAMARLVGGALPAMTERELQEGGGSVEFESVAKGLKASAIKRDFYAGIDPVGAILGYKAREGDPLGKSGGAERLRVVGDGWMDEQERQDWKAVLFAELVSKESDKPRREAVLAELLRLKAGPEDKALDGRRFGQVWSEWGGSSLGLEISRLAGCELPWAKGGKPVLVGEVNESQAFAGALEALERQSGYIDLGRIESSLRLGNGDFSWGWKDAQGITPLISVCLKEPAGSASGIGGPEALALEILGRKGACSSLDAQTEGLGFTALMLAVDRGYGKLAAALLEAGADPRLADCQGRSAIDRAAQRLDVRLGAKMGAAVKVLASNESARREAGILGQADIIDSLAKRRQREAYPEAGDHGQDTKPRA